MFITCRYSGILLGRLTMILVRIILHYQTVGTKKPLLPLSENITDTRLPAITLLTY